MISPIFYTDFYKTGHIYQYPKNTTKVYSNITPRGSRSPGIDKIVVFGIQYFIKDYLIRRFNDGFFKQPKAEILAKYQRRMDTSLGPGAIKTEHIEALHGRGARFCRRPCNPSTRLSRSRRSSSIASSDRSRWTSIRRGR